MQEGARIKRHRNLNNQSGMIVTISPEMPGRHPFNFKLSSGLLTSIIIFLGLATVGFVSVTAMLYRSYQNYSGVRQVNQELSDELAFQGDALKTAELTVDEMTIALDDLLLLRNENAELEQKLKLTRIELEASERTVSQMNISMQELLSQLGSVDRLVQELQILAGLEPAEMVSDSAPVDVTTATGGDLETVSFETLATGLSGLVGSARSNLSTLSASISEVRDTVAYQQAVADATPRVWPAKGYISSYFGWRKSPISGKQQSHKGMDIVAPFKSPVVATASGEVLRAGWSNSGYGNYVVINHGFGMKTLYAHLNAISVNVGDTIGIGDEVGLLGNTGYSTGPHLHYEVWLNEVPTNPGDYLP